MAISARTGQGIDRLTQAVSETLTHNFLDLDVETGVDNGRLLAQLAAYGEILSQQFSDTRVVVHCRIPRRALAHLQGTDVTIRPRTAPVAEGASGLNGHPGPLDWPLDGSLAARASQNGTRH